MDCVEVQALLKVVVDRRGGSRQAEALEAHLRSCPACRAFESDIARIQQLLRSGHEPPMPSDLPDRLLAAIPDARRLPTRRLLAMAASVVLAVGVILGVLLQGHLAPVDQETHVHTSDWQLESVTLSMEAPRDLSDVVFRVELPPNVEIQGYPGQRTLEWVDDLATGPNQLTLPLIRIGSADGELVATLTHEGRSRHLRVPLDAEP